MSVAGSTGSQWHQFAPRMAPRDGGRPRVRGSASDTEQRQTLALGEVLEVLDVQSHEGQLVGQAAGRDPRVVLWAGTRPCRVALAEMGCCVRREGGERALSGASAADLVLVG